MGNKSKARVGKRAGMSWSMVKKTSPMKFFHPRFTLAPRANTAMGSVLYRDLGGPLGEKYPLRQFHIRLGQTG